MRDLSEIRVDIDEVDRRLFTLFEKRLKLSDEVAEYKRLKNMAVFDPEREQEKLEKIKKMSDDPFVSDAAAGFFSEIMSISKKRQQIVLGAD